MIDPAKLIDPFSKAGFPASLPLPVISARPADGEMRLSFAQQQVWLLSHFDTAGNAQNTIGHAIELSGALDVDAMRASVRLIARRHASLRTRCGQRDGVPYQIVDSFTEIEIPLIEIESRDLNARIDAHAQHVFDLENGPLWKLGILRLSANKHVFLIHMHQIVSDQTSIGILLSDLTALYNAAIDGKPSPLSALPIQYTDFAEWQRQWIDQGGATPELSYWKERLRGAPALLAVPTDRPRPAAATHCGSTAPFRLPQTLYPRLNALSQHERATLFMTLLTAFKVLVWRYSHQTDIVLGVPVAGRNQPGVERLIGLFTNTLVLRTQMHADESFSTLLQRVKKTVLEAQDHEEIPFDYLVNQLNPERTLSYTPIVQVMFAFQPTPLSALHLRGIEATWLEQNRETMRFDMDFSLFQTPEEITGTLEYSTDLFDRATIEHLLDHYGRLLEAIAASPEERISRYELLSEEEWQQVVVEWNRNQQEYPQELTLHGLFQAQVERTPDAIALVFEGAHLSYGACNARANQLAHYLITQGVGPEVRVGLCLERSLDMMIGILGILKAGGAYIPLDPSYPKQRLDYIVADAEVQCVVTHTHLRNHLSDSVRCVCLDEVRPAIAQQPEETPVVPVVSQNLAYVIHTSGSTGHPKGVMITHRNVVNLTYAQQKRLAGIAGSRVLQFASFSFDGSVWEFVMAWIRGATLVLAPKERMLPGEGLTGLMIQEAVDIATLPPSALAVLSPESLPAFKVLISAGEALSRAQVTPWLPGRTVMNGYGPTESTVDASVGDVSGEGPITIGRPIANIAFYLLDSTLQPVPIGVAGELYIGGAGLARGYFHRPELSAERFLPNPFAAAGDRMYRTGDLARHCPDGRVEILGRSDHQVKVRGFRIELGEIEATLARHPAIAQVLVLASGDGETKRLIAYYTQKSTAVRDSVEDAPAASELRKFLQKTLPEHMVPGFFVSLDVFPLTPNGKIDRAALPAPDASRALAPHYAPPRTPIEQTLANIWQQVLRLPQVGLHDNFFDIGGHSLSAVRAVARLRQQLGLDVTIRDLFACPVLGNLAHRLEGALQAELPPIDHAERGGHLPLSFAQQRLWFLAQMEGVSEAYHIPWGVRLKGGLDPSALRRALGRIVARHEVLRTTFAVLDGEPLQQIAAVGDSGFSLLEDDLRGRDDALAELEGQVIEEASRSFDLKAGPLIRGRLIRLGENEHALLLTMHHIVSDGWSMNVLFRELSALYSAFVRGEDDPLPELKIQYADYAVWQRQWMEGAILQQQASYWKTALAGAPTLLELPMDHLRPAQQDFTGAFVGLSLEEELTAALRELSRRHTTTLFMTLLVGWAALLARLSGQQDVVIGTPTANRSRTEIENLIGFFVNTLALRIDLSSSPTVGQLLARVKQGTVAAQQHQDIPFEQVVELAHPVRSLAHSPLFQAMFSWENTDDSTLDLQDLELQPLATVPDRAAKFDLTLFLREANGSVVGGVDYATSLFTAATIERYLEYFRSVLKAMVNDDRQLIACLPMLAESERQQLLYDWNRTQTTFASGQCVHQLFELQMTRTPDAVALICEGNCLSYAQLNRSANQLAHYLRELGVAPDQRVAICVERGLEMIVGILAVLKAGGAYVPLDPAYPPERLAFLLQDSAPLALLTQTDLRTRMSEHKPTLPVLDLTLPTPAWYNRPDSNLAPHSMGLKPDHLAYVIYTSGSTGNPKGVMISHRSLGNLIQWHKDAFALQSEQQSSSVAGVGFDAATWEIWPPLCVGAALALPSSAESSDPEALLDWWKGQKLDVSFLPTPMAEFAFTHGISNLHLHTLLVGGDRLRQLPSAPAPFVLVNNYGPTETTVVATSGRVEANATVPSIGRAIANTQIYILDGQGEPVPVGVAGELYIGGAGVARGYLNRADLTAEKFVPNPFATAPGERMYRTGDLGRWRSDGNIDFLGRNDFQVKIRGFRIELGEIEATLARHPAIAQVLVTVSEEGESKRLIAYYTLKPVVEGDGAELAPTASVLHKFLQKTLPEHMVPGVFVSMDAFPLTPNGKIDRAALPAPEVAAMARQYAAPRTLIEQNLAAIWQEVLRVPQVGVHANFFEIGGHSLLVGQLTARIKQALGVEVPFIELYKHPTVAELAAQVTGTTSDQSSWPELESSASPLVVLCARETGAPLVLLPGIAGALPGYYDLAQAVGQLRPVYGLHALSIQETAISHTVENIAQLYVSSLLDVWDEGPLHILGHSYGGMVAFEMVKQLERQGRDVDSLILVDVHPSALKTIDLPPNVFVLRYMGEILRLEDAAIEEATKKLEFASREQVAAFMHELVCKRDADGSSSYERIYQRVCTIQSRYIHTYTPAVYTPRARVLKIWAEDGAMREAGETSAGHVDATWRQMLQKETDRVVVPGDHETLFRHEYTPRLARLLNDWIEEKTTEGFDRLDRVLSPR